MGTGVESRGQLTGRLDGKVLGVRQVQGLLPLHPDLHHIVVQVRYLPAGGRLQRQFPATDAKSHLRIAVGIHTAVPGGAIRVEQTVLDAADQGAIQHGLVVALHAHQGGQTGQGAVALGTAEALQNHAPVGLIEGTAACGIVAAVTDDYRKCGHGAVLMLLLIVREFIDSHPVA